MQPVSCLPSLLTFLHLIRKRGAKKLTRIGKTFSLAALRGSKLARGAIFPPFSRPRDFLLAFYEPSVPEFAVT